MANENSGALFRNDRKEKDTHPDYTGTININGVEYWQSAWIKEKDGKKYFSQSFKPKEQPTQQESMPVQNDDTDLPF